MDIQPSLINRCIKGERKAEYELFNLCFSYLMSICIRYTRQQEKAKEVLNMGFYKVIVNLKKYDQAQPFKPWLRRVMINTLINEYKKEKVHYGNHMYVESYFEDGKTSDTNEALGRINAKQIYALIEKLPPASAQVFNLYFIDGFRHAEIAEMLKISEGTSKWHLNSAREKLKVMLKEELVKENIEVK
jgi:RNA polymerase sigma factor (sigma-70 family)